MFLFGNVTRGILHSPTQAILDTTPFILYLKTSGGLAGFNNLLSYNSFTKEAISITNNNETTRQISQIDEDTSIRILNNSGYFDTDNFYPPLPNSTGYTEYTLVVVLGSDIHALYWTDTTEGVPDAVRNLPFALNNLLGHQIQTTLVNDKMAPGH